MPFVGELVQDERDAYESFERDAPELAAYVVATGREPVLKMRASVQDFVEVMTDRTVASVILRGFGNFSAVSTPLRCGEDLPYGMLDWRILAGMADHLKLGRFVMRTCAGLGREFNPPLAFGVVSSHRNIHAAVGRVIRVVGLDDEENELIRPITHREALSRHDIMEEFPLQRQRHVPGILPDRAYVAARALQFCLHDPWENLPGPVPIDTSIIPTSRWRARSRALSGSASCRLSGPGRAVRLGVCASGAGGDAGGVGGIRCGYWPSRGVRGRGQGQRPSKVGFCFARNAATAAWWSAVAPVNAMSRPSCASDSSSGCAREYATARRTAP